LLIINSVVCTIVRGVETGSHIYEFLGRI
jgi:hypothetical protein